MRAVGRQCSEELRRLRQENERLAAEAQAQRQREAALEAEVGGIEGARDVLETRLVDAESRARLAAAGRATLHEELTPVLHLACSAAASPAHTLVECAAALLHSHLTTRALLPEQLAGSLCAEFAAADPRDLPTFALALARLCNDVTALVRMRTLRLH